KAPAVDAVPEAKTAAAPYRDFTKGRVVVVPIKGDIDLGLAPFVERVTSGLRDGDTLIFDIDTFGGRVDAGVRIRDAILGAKPRTVAFVNRRAISAGALIALAADVIAMTPGGTIGAATPVQMGMPSEGMKPVEEKVVSYMRKEMKATAEAKGRRSDIAEAMVDSDVEIEGINKKGKVLTLTTDEAVKHGIAAYQVGTLVELQEKLGVAGRAPEHAAVNWAERVARALTNPVVSSLLMTVGFLGLLIELYTGGHGFALLASLVCLGLFFFGHMVVRLAGWEEIALFAAGAILLGVEIFVIPGFGLTGALGILAIVASLVMALVDLGPIPLDVSWASGILVRAVAQVMWAIVLTTALGVAAARVLPRTPIGRRLVLAAASTGRASTLEADPLLAQDGVAATDLRPGGMVLVGGQRLDAVSDGPFIEKGTAIKVLRVEGGHVVVRRG
ncbi:MAG: NfeD family protein, partial [Myxococcota bacterium]